MRVCERKRETQRAHGTLYMYYFSPKPKMDDGFCALFAVESEPHCIYSIMLNSILLPLFSSHHANRGDVHIRIFTPIALLHAFSLSHDIKRVFRTTSS